MHTDGNGAEQRNAKPADLSPGKEVPLPHFQTGSKGFFSRPLCPLRSFAAKPTAACRDKPPSAVQTPLPPVRKARLEWWTPLPRRRTCFHPAERHSPPCQTALEPAECPFAPVEPAFRQKNVGSSGVEPAFRQKNAGSSGVESAFCQKNANSPASNRHSAEKTGFPRPSNRHFAGKTLIRPRRIAILPPECRFDAVGLAFCRQNLDSTPSKRHFLGRMGIRRREK